MVCISSEWMVVSETIEIPSTCKSSWITSGNVPNHLCSFTTELRVKEAFLPHLPLITFFAVYFLLLLFGHHLSRFGLLRKNSGALSLPQLEKSKVFVAIPEWGRVWNQMKQNRRRKSREFNVFTVCSMIIIGDLDGKFDFLGIDCTIEFLMWFFFSEDLSGPNGQG